MSGDDGYQGNTLSATVVPTEQERARRFVARMARDAEDAALLCDAVFGGKRHVRRPKGTIGKKVAHRSTYKYPCPVGPEGHRYRLKIRAWGRAQGHTVISTGPVEGWLLNAYVEATGDAWESSSRKASTA